MDTQLHLITDTEALDQTDGQAPSPPWQMDGTTITTGQRGVALARAALRRAARPAPATSRRHRPHAA